MGTARGPHPPTIASGSNQQCHASCSNQQHLPKLVQNDQKTSTARRFTHISQATQREDTQALRRSRPSGPPRESSGARSGPPSPWGSGEKKKRIIDALKNELSDIHLFIGDETRTTPTGRGINYARIHELYTPKHDMNNFCQNFKRLIEHKKNKTGPFTETKKKSDKNEPWYMSSNKTCLGYTLLHDLHLKKWNIINPMKPEEIWKLEPEFQKYLLKDFMTYNKNMKSLVSKRVMRAATENDIYQEDMQNHPQKQITCRGTPFWGQHAACKMLMKDVEDGIDKIEI
jgi:hypothetical protein